MILKNDGLLLAEGIGDVRGLLTGDNDTAERAEIGDI